MRLRRKHVHVTEDKLSPHKLSYRCKIDLCCKQHSESDRPDTRSSGLCEAMMTSKLARVCNVSAEPPTL